MIAFQSLACLAKVGDLLLLVLDHFNLVQGGDKSLLKHLFRHLIASNGLNLSDLLAIFWVLQPLPHGVQNLATSILR
jgi:hypothetical protein